MAGTVANLPAGNWKPSECLFLFDAIVCSSALVKMTFLTPPPAHHVSPRAQQCPPLELSHTIKEIICYYICYHWCHRSAFAM
jgi:hypothetical protein